MFLYNAVILLPFLRRRGWLATSAPHEPLVEEGGQHPAGPPGPRGGAHQG